MMGYLTKLIVTFVVPSPYDIEYVVCKAIISVVMVALSYVTYRYLPILKRTGYILNNCLIFASSFLPSIGFALDSYYTSFSGRYDIGVASGCFWVLFITLLLFWFLPNAIYFDKRKKIFSNEENLNEKSVYNSEKTKNIVGMVTKENKSTETNEQVVFCRKCGTQLLIDSVFCNKCGAKVEETMKRYPVHIFDSTTHTLRKEMKDFDVTKFPHSKFANNDIYNAIETIRDGKKVRIYYTKENWYKQIETEISAENYAGKEDILSKLFVNESEKASGQPHSGNGNIAQMQNVVTNNMREVRRCERKEQQPK